MLQPESKTRLSDYRSPAVQNLAEIVFHSSLFIVFANLRFLTSDCRSQLLWKTVISHMQRYLRSFAFRDSRPVSNWRLKSDCELNGGDDYTWIAWHQVSCYSVCSHVSKSKASRGVPTWAD